MCKVTIVIPVYNVEQYLKDCLISVINQTLDDIEIICVNDGSNDNSGKILDDFALKDSRIKVIHKENGGYGKAMNVGIENAKGKYIGIVEPDDYVELQMFEILYNKAIETNVDIVKSDFYQFSEDLIPHIIKLDYSNLYYNRILQVQNEVSLFNVGMNTWTGLYKTSFLRNNNIKYNETPGARYQDQGFWFQTITFANSVFIVNRPFYHYRYFKTNSSNNKKGFDWIQKEYQYIYSILKSKKDINKNIWSMYYKFKFCHYLFNYKKLDKKEKKEKLDFMRNEFIQDSNNSNFDILVFNNYEKNFLYLLIKKPKEFYRKITNTSTFVQKLFSIKNQGRHKIICVLGIKFKLKNKFLEQKEQLERIEDKLDVLNCHLSILQEVNKIV